MTFKLPPVFSVLLSFWVITATAQEPMDHRMHHGMSGDSAGPTWRMPPMDMSMPMLPGLERAVPVVAPFLPSVDRSRLPKASERAIVELADGDTLRMEAALVTKSIAGKTLTMYGYNGQIPGPLIRVDQASTIYVRFLNNIEMPTTVDLEVKDTEPGLKGATASASSKPATLETGVVVAVPQFVDIGDTVRVDTSTGAYVTRV